MAQSDRIVHLHNFAGVFWLEMLRAAQERRFRCSKFNNITCHLSAAVNPELNECFHTVEHMLNAKGQSRSKSCNSKHEKTLWGYEYHFINKHAIICIHRRCVHILEMKIWINRRRGLHKCALTKTSLLEGRDNNPFVWRSNCEGEIPSNHSGNRKWVGTLKRGPVSSDVWKVLF